MSGFESFAIGLAANLATDKLARLRDKSFNKALAAMVIESTKLPVSRNKLENFLATDRAWELLVAGDAANRAAIEAELRALVNPTGRKATRWSTEQLEAAIAEGARVLLNCFLGALGDADGREVADYRNDLRTHLVRGDIRAANSKQFETTLAALPYPCRHWLQQHHEIDGAAAGRLAQVLEDRTTTPSTVADDLAADPLPAWLGDLPWQGWEAVAQFLVAYGLSSATAEDHAVDAGSPYRVHYLCRQAINASNDEDLDRADLLLADAPDDQDLLVRTTAAYVARDAAAVVALTADAPTGHLIEDAQVFVARLRIWGLANNDRVDDAIDAADRLTARFPERAAPWTTLAELAFAESLEEPTGSERQARLYEKAANAARRARDLTHSWNGDAVDMSRLLIRMLTVLDRVDEAIRVGAPPPEGDATPVELADPEIRGSTEITRAIFQRTVDATADIGDYYRHFCAAVLAVEEEQQVEELKAALAAATGDDQLITTQLFLARRQHIDPDLVAHARTLSDEAADLIEATYAAAVDDFTTAEARLRPHPVSEPHVLLLGDVLCKQGKVDEAVTMLEAAAGHLGNDTLAAIAVSTLVGADRVDDAESVALRLLTMNLPKGDGTHYVRRFLVKQAQSRNDLNDVVRYAKALLRDFADDHEAAWVIVYSNYVAGRFKVAWEELQNLHLTPYDERTAILAIDLTGRYRGDDPNAANDILAITRAFADEEMVHACAIATVMTRFGQTPLPEDTLQRVRDLTDDFVKKYPNSSAFISIDASDIEKLVERLKEMLEPAARVRAELAAGVHASAYPFGVFADSLDRTRTVLSYASVYPILLPVVAEHDLSRDADRVGAEQAIGKAVAVDHTVALIDGLLDGQDLWGFAQQHLGEMRTTSELVADAERSVDKAGDKHNGFINFDPFDDQFFVSDDTVEQDARLLALVTRMRDRLAACTNTPAPALPTELQPDQPVLLTWLGPLALAVDQHIPLYTDDAHLRRIAREFGIPAFGTDALLEALVRNTTIPIRQQFEFQKALVEHNFGDIPAVLSYLNLVLNEHDFHDTARYTGNLSRPAVWRRHHDLIVGFNDLIRLIADTDPDAIPAWVFAATTGLGLAVILEQRENVLGTLITLAIVAARLEPARTAAIVAAGRSAAARLDPHRHLDPAPGIVRGIWELTEHLDLTFDQRRQYVTTLFSECGDDIARDLTRAILGLDPDRTAAIGATTVDDD